MSTVNTDYSKLKCAPGADPKKVVSGRMLQPLGAASRRPSRPRKVAAAHAARVNAAHVGAVNQYHVLLVFFPNWNKVKDNIDFSAWWMDYPKTCLDFPKASLKVVDSPALDDEMRLYT